MQCNFAPKLNLHNQIMDIKSISIQKDVATGKYLCRIYDPCYKAQPPFVVLSDFSLTDFIVNNL